jgi:hypothetical protein
VLSRFHCYLPMRGPEGGRRASGFWAVVSDGGLGERGGGIATVGGPDDKLVKGEKGEGATKNGS